MDPLRTKILKGRFEVLDLVAETATGLLFKGRVVPDSEIPGVNPGADVFIKIVTERAHRREGAIERYTREVAGTARLGFDRHFVRYLDVDVVGGRLIVVTLAWPSRSLAALMAADQRIPYAGLLRAIRDLTEGLEVARTEGVSDRHVRCDDLLINPVSGEAKILRLTTPYARTVDGLTQIPEHGETSDLVLVGTMFYRLTVLSEPFTRSGEGAQAEAERLSAALKLTYANVTPDEVARAARLFTRLVLPGCDAPPLTYPGVVAFVDDLEAASEELTKSRARLKAWNRRRTGSSLLHTAFDTVAAMRGEIKAPAEAGPAGPVRPVRPVRTAANAGAGTGASVAAGAGAGAGTGDSTGSASANLDPAIAILAAPTGPAPLSPAEQAVLIWSRIDLGPVPLLGDNPYLMGMLTLSIGFTFLLTLYWLLFR